MNVIVIVTDSLRADAVGCYGSRVKTPNLDRLAAEGTLFERAYSESLPTMPTRTSWWTGRVQFPFRGWQQFETADLLLAEVLYDKGYTSALVSDCYHMFKPVYNCGRGFDNVFWVRGQQCDPWVQPGEGRADLERYYRFRGDDSDPVWREIAEQHMRNASVRVSEEDYAAPRVIKQAMRWLESVTTKKRDRLFLWVDCFDPHEPWDPPEPYWSMYDSAYKGQELIDPVPGPVEGYLTPEELRHTKALYDGEVSFVDKWVGVLLDYLRDTGLYENTFIMQVSDHGEPFGEHGIIRKAQPWNYTELVHVPWIVRHPDGLGAGSRVPAIVQTTDLMPTVLDALGISRELRLDFIAPVKTGVFPQDTVVSSRDIALHGHSLLPLLRGEIDAVRDYACIGHGGASWTIRDHDWSYHLFLDGQRPSELYDLRRDWGEEHNLAAEEPDVAAHQELALRRFVANLR
ncbi:MAG: sulfatase [Anaerolineae bacterium]